MRPECPDDASWTHWSRRSDGDRVDGAFQWNSLGRGAGPLSHTAGRGPELAARQEETPVIDIVKRGARALAAFVETLVDWLW